MRNGKTVPVRVAWAWEDILIWDLVLWVWGEIKLMKKPVLVSCV
jgi:hypothetical protein